MLYRALVGWSAEINHGEATSANSSGFFEAPNVPSSAGPNFCPASITISGYVGELVKCQAAAPVWQSA